MSDLLYDPAALEAADTIVICVPGALSSVQIFDPVSEWGTHGYGVALYRFPGLDGRPVAPPLSIDAAARDIVALAAQFAPKPVRLLGYSTGGPIVITAAAQMSGDVKVAAMSSAVEGGGGLRTGLAGLWDVLFSAGRAVSMDRTAVWMEYYRVLLCGRAVLSDRDLAAKADQIIAAHKSHIVMPDGGKPRAHTDALRSWRLPKGAQFRADELAFFVGLADPVFSRAQSMDFAAQCGQVSVTGYPGEGHLLFLSCDSVFEDVRAFFEGRARDPKSPGQVLR